ncbi:MAG: hypothetical protein JKY96_07365 [Phycisphaerales bacterium]|nr:hypothetical protein [Phycisphaerales bacterium]
MNSGQDQSGSMSETRQRVMESAQLIAGEIPTPQLRSLICPFCGAVTPDTGRCKTCQARFDPLSRQATQNHMGPWCIRDAESPFRPGCTYDTLVRLIDQGAVGIDTIIRGPTTRQFWTLARHTPSVSHRLGVCHNCQGEVDKASFQCPSCQASFTPERDRQHMGLGSSRPLPGQGNPKVLAMHAEPAAGNDAPRAALNAGASGAGTGALTNEASDAIRQWRRAFESERRRAWIAVGLAGVATILALVYGVVGVSVFG